MHTLVELRGRRSWAPQGTCPCKGKYKGNTRVFQKKAIKKMKRGPFALVPAELVCLARSPTARWRSVTLVARLTIFFGNSYNCVPHPNIRLTGHKHVAAAAVMGGENIATHSLHTFSVEPHESIWGQPHLRPAPTPAPASGANSRSADFHVVGPCTARRGQKNHLRL